LFWVAVNYLIYYRRIDIFHSKIDYESFITFGSILTKHTKY